MTRYTSRLLNYLTVSGAALLLSACGGGGGGDASTGSLSVGITDLPATGNEDVCIHFTGITLHHSDGDQIHIPYDPSTYVDSTGACIDNVPADAPPPADPANNAVNLSSLQGELSVSLMDSEEVRAGQYNWIRLDVDESLSYVMDDGQQKDLRCPSCDTEQSGLKLNRGFTVPAGGETDFMIDLDLGKSLKRNPDGSYTLRPTLRLIDNTETGKITGTVAVSLIPGMISENDTGCKVYVYEGHGIVPDDYHETDTILTSAKVLYNSESGFYEYVAAFLPTDSAAEPTLYTVALTCDVDDPEVDQNNDPQNLTGVDDVIFTDGINEGVGQETQVVTDQTTIVDFPPM